MSRSSHYKNIKKNKPKELPPKAELMGENLSARGIEILNRFEKNKRQGLKINTSISDTPSYLSDKSAESSTEKEEDINKNKTNNFLSEFAIDNKLKDHKIESDRFLYGEISKINGRVDNVVLLFPKWSIGVIVTIGIMIGGFYLHVDLKFDSIKNDFLTWKKTIELEIDKLKVANSQNIKK